MGGASEDVSDYMTSGTIGYGSCNMVGGTVVSGNDDILGGASEGEAAIESVGDVIVDAALLSNDIVSKATESENGGTVSGAEGESNKIVGGTTEGM